MDQTLVRTALKLNAGFSGLSGLLLIFLPDLTGQLLGITAPIALQAVGVGLLIFSADLLHQATREKVAGWRVLYASLGDFIWVILSILGVMIWGQLLSPTGIFAIIAVAAVVLFFGATQIAGLKKMYFLPDENCYGYTIRCSSKADADSLWQVIRNLGDIADYGPDLASSQLEKTRAEELPIRACEDVKGNRWRERCIVFDDALKYYDVKFLTRDPGFPYPATWMIGGWQVTPTKDGGAEVVVWWQLKPNPRWLAPAILAILALSVDRTFPQVIRNMEKHALSDSTGRAKSSRTQATF